ncbi:glycosyltransferase family 2 protein [Candidatus Nomurabacteria bacterium]|nr:glycosyltransferase family 2 protein [Candidatus Nomurabacteria bacterium]
MHRGKTVSVIIPTYNEEGSIRAVINGLFDTGVVDEVVVIDNNALGNTKMEVAQTRARLVEEREHQGYGNAMMRGLHEATGDLVITVEGDGTFLPQDVHKFLSYTDDFEVIFGTRTSRAAIWSGAFMPFPVRLGNWAVAKFLEVLHNGPSMTDVSCSYKLFSRGVLNSIFDLFYLSDGKDAFSIEIMIWVIRRGWKPIEIPVIYKERIGTSMYTGESVAKAAKIGLKMVLQILRYRLMSLRPPKNVETVDKITKER